jgi:hypothetical protein
MQKVLRPFFFLVFIFSIDFSLANNSETKSALGELAKNYQQVWNLIKANQPSMSEDKSQAIALLENFRQKLLEIDALSSNTHSTEACRKVKTRFLDAKTSVIIMTYQAQGFEEFPELKSRLESLLARTNQEILQQEELLNCVSRTSLVEGNILDENPVIGSLEEEFFSSVEGFRKQMQKARTDEVAEPLPPIAGQRENPREQGGSGGPNKSQRKSSGSETESNPRENEPTRSEESDSDCKAGEDRANDTCKETETPSEKTKEADQGEPNNEPGPEVTEEYDMPDYDENTDDIVARQIREAAMSEKDPELRKKLWREYEKYKESL